MHQDKFLHYGSTLYCSSLEHVTDKVLQGLPLVNESRREDVGPSFHHKCVLRTHLCSMALSFSTAVAILTQIIALHTVNAVVPLGTILEANRNRFWL